MVLYHPLSVEKDPQTASKPALFQRHHLATILLSITTIILGAQVLFLSLQSNVHCTVVPGEDGRPTEWEPAKESIKLEEVLFTSPLQYNATSKEYYREYDPSGPQYAGPPSPEIDSAWDELIGGRYLLLSDEEAMQLDDPVSIDGAWVAEVEVMHSLHCLNAVRMALTPEYYAKGHHSGRLMSPIHIEHCLEQLRQTIQCSSDLTPVPVRPTGEAPKIALVGTPMKHTCRSWDSFQRWHRQRGDEKGKL